MSDNLECTAFRQVYDKVSTGVRSALTSLANVAFAKRLIHDNIVEQATNLSVPIEYRTECFLLAIFARIRADSSAFHEFIKLLEDESSMDYLAKILRETFEEKRENDEDMKRKQKEAADQEQRERAKKLAGAYHLDFAYPPCSSGQSVGDSASGIQSMANIQYPHSIKPEHLPLRNFSSRFNHESPMNQLGIDGYGPQSEPVLKKHVDSPGKLFCGSLMHTGTHLQGDTIAVTRRVPVSPDSQRRISTGGMGYSTLKPFKNNHSATQLTLLPSTHGKPAFSKASPTLSPSAQYRLYPPTNHTPTSHNADALINTFEKFNICSPGAIIKVPSDNMGLSDISERRRRSSLPSRMSDASNQGGGKTLKSLQTERNDTGDAACSSSEPHYFKSREVNPSGGAGEQIENHLPQELSKKLADMNNSTSDSGIEFAATEHAPTPSEPTIPSSNPQSAPQSEDSDNGVIESQDTTVGCNHLACGHLRQPSLYSSSSVDSNSPFPSPEINPVQVSEKSPGEYHPLSSKRSVRPRCKKCAKLKQECNTLREKLDEVQSNWAAEREQNDKQIRALTEELHRQRQDNYELTQRVYSSEVRHKEAAKTIQQLNFELQLVIGQLQLQQAEQERLKEAYDYCSRAKCELLKVRLQRADSMQCPESTYYENTADMNQHLQYNTFSGPNNYTNAYHKPAVNGSHDHYSQWQTTHF